MTDNRTTERLMAMLEERGKSFPRNKLYLAHNHGEINYCPNCGAKVVKR